MTTHHAFARTVTDRLDPKTWITAVSLGIGWAAAGISGLAWGACALLFSAVLPLIAIKAGIRRGAWADRHLDQRRQRITVMLLIIGSLALATAVMARFHAPSPVIAAILAMLATLLALLAVTPFWKISVHTAIASGATAMLTLTWPPSLIPCLLLLSLVAWSRLALRAHTPLQVLAGATLGALTASAIFLPTA